MVLWFIFGDCGSLILVIGGSKLWIDGSKFLGIDSLLKLGIVVQIVVLGFEWFFGQNSI